MNVDCRYTAGLGDNALYARVRRLGQYWDSVNEQWDNAESAATKTLLTEYPDAGDSAQSYYAASVTPPVDATSVEIVRASTGATLFSGSPTGSGLTPQDVADAALLAPTGQASSLYTLTRNTERRTRRATVTTLDPKTRRPLSAEFDDGAVLTFDYSDPAQLVVTEDLP